MAAHSGAKLAGYALEVARNSGIKHRSFIPAFIPLLPATYRFPGRCCTIIHLNQVIMETPARFTETFQVAEIDLIYKTGFNVTERPKITQAADAYELLLKSWNPGRLGFIEEFKILLLNQGNFVLAEYQVSQGGVSATSVDIRLIFAAALKANASGLILAHNHPSGAPRKRISVMYETENQKVPVFEVGTVVKGAGLGIKTYPCLEPP